LLENKNVFFPRKNENGAKGTLIKENQHNKVNNITIIEQTEGIGKETHIFCC